MGLIVFLAGLLCVSNIHGFLASDCPVRGQFLVVEGWIPDYSIPTAVSEFEKNGYRQIICVGGQSHSEATCQKVDVFTLGAHARRSRLLFEKALGDEVAMGVIAAPDQTYDQDHWWRSSNGVRTVLSELIAYLYAVIFFHP